jgi:deoxyribodipyrimidine photo-lyase
MGLSLINVFWFRRDLRLDDNAGLYHALRSGIPVLAIFIFDTDILERLENKKDRRVQFIHEAITALDVSLREMGSGLSVFHGKPLDIFKQLSLQYSVQAVYTNHDYEPYAINRDNKIKLFLEERDIIFKTFKDQVIFEKDEVVKPDGSAYTVFTPYSRKWKSCYSEYFVKPYPSKKYFHNFLKAEVPRILSLREIGFAEASLNFSQSITDEELIRNYGNRRDYPAQNGTSRVGVYLRFGTISIRNLVARAAELSEVYLNELIWREFYQCILFHHPRVAEGYSFKPAYDRIHWRTDQGEFSAWCEGRTGYPIVDAGMRELNETGFMHNRVRMITASFLCKHLLLDWRLGEAYFAEKLLDFELASNNGGWQWAAGSGCDAAPYFRIFNPYLQTKKFDPKLEYIRKWVPEFEDFVYPKPIVDHEFARKRCIEVYSEGLRKDG